MLGRLGQAAITVQACMSFWRILCVSTLARAGCGPLYSAFVQLASCSRADAMKGVVTRPSRGLPKCSKRGCANDAVSHRAKFCAACFTENACVAGRMGRGNTKVGKPKKEAGKRSGVKRSARYALVVKKEWLDKILSGQKDWEIRGSADRSELLAKRRRTRSPSPGPPASALKPPQETAAPM